MARMMLKELDEITETVKYWAENPKSDTAENNKHLYNYFRPSQWLLLTHSLILYATTVGSKIPHETHQKFYNFSTSRFYCNGLEYENPEFFRTILDSAAKYWLPLSDNFKLGYAALANFIGMECLSDEFRHENKIAKKFFQGVSSENFNDENLKIYIKDMTMIATAMPLFLKYPNGFLRLLMGLDYLSAVFKRNTQVRHYPPKWNGNFSGDYSSLLLGALLGKVITIQNLIHQDFGCRQGRSNSFADELDIIESYRTFFRQSAERGGYVINHTIPYDKEILTDFLDYPKSIRNSLMVSKMFN